MSAPPSREHDAPSTDENAVRALYRQMLEGWNTRNPQAFAAAFAEDGEVIGFDGSQMSGRTEIAATLQQIFTTTRFPEMGVDWRTHRDNVGHLYSLGCFRCHDDQHASRDGKRISKDCTICHSVLGEGEAGSSSGEDLRGQRADRDPLRAEPEGRLGGPSGSAPSSDSMAPSTELACVIARRRRRVKGVTSPHAEATPALLKRDSITSER